MKGGFANSVYHGVPIEAEASNVYSVITRSADQAAEKRSAAVAILRNRAGAYFELSLSDKEGTPYTIGS